jgi:hypothetical protein
MLPALRIVSHHHTQCHIIMRSVNLTSCHTVMLSAELCLLFRECVLFIGTQFSILYTSMYSPAEAATRLGWRIHGSVEDTKLSTNKQHSLSE